MATTTQTLTDLDQTIVNGLEIYTLSSETGAHGHKTTYQRATCKSGRLKGREVMLRKLDKDASAMHGLKIHQSLHHPTIVSILSAFSSSNGLVHILELCPHGNLESYLDAASSKTLDIEELKGLTKNLAEALVYLERELVLHNSLSLDTVYVMEPGRFKLGGFECAVRVNSADVCHKPVTDTSTQSPFFSSPEYRKGAPFSFPSDIWSLGCIIIACFTSIYSFKKAIGGQWDGNVETILSSTSTTLQKDNEELIREVLRIVPESRLTANDVLQHPFLTVGQGHDKEKLPEGSSRQHKPKVYFTQGQQSRNPALTTKSSRRSASDPIRPPRRGLKSILEEVEYEELELNGTKDQTWKPAKRIVSCPSRFGPADKENHAMVPDLARRASRRETEGKHAARPYSRDEEDIPIGTERPTPLNVASMRPQTHKSTHGTLTILPSRSLLVDFRESQRRRGQKSDSVLIISGDGSTVSTYYAPNAGSAGPYGKPVHEYDLESLPPAFWKLYNDAGKLIEQIKQRTPSLVVYSSFFKCTLMSNEPAEDVELLYHEPPSVASSEEMTPAEYQLEVKPLLRLRLSRRTATLEISKRIFDLRGEEWVNRTITATLKPPYVSSQDLVKLDTAERISLHYLSQFLECSNSFNILLHQEPGVERTGSPKEIFHELGTPEEPPSGLQPSSCGSLLLNLAPRPPKLSAFVRQPPGVDVLHSADNVSYGLSSTRANWTVTEKTWCNKSRSIPTVQPAIDQDARFIPSIGWCIRHASEVTQGGRYQVMFLDGYIMEVDVDEEWVETCQVPGPRARHRILDCASDRNLAGRMKSFERFISLFDQAY